MLIENSKWIRKKDTSSTIVPIFRKRFKNCWPVKSATLEITYDGVYEAADRTCRYAIPAS